MRTLKIDVAAEPYKEKSFIIGRRFEHYAQVIIFDYSKLAKEYGPGEVELEYKRAIDDLPIEAAFKCNDDLKRAYWAIDETATAFPGQGMVEFTYKSKDADELTVIKNAYNFIVLPGVWG